MSKKCLIFKHYRNPINIEYNKNSSGVHEANFLMLDCSKANHLLKWKPVSKINETIEYTISWYKNFYTKNSVNTENDIRDCIKRQIR